MQTRDRDTRIRPASYPVEIYSYGSTTNISTLTTLLAFTDLGSDFRHLTVFMLNTDGANNANLVIDLSHGSTGELDEMTKTVSIPALKEGYFTIDDPNPFTYIRIAGQTDSPSFPVVAIKWSVVGFRR
jgi:hypothetical protein